MEFIGRTIKKDFQGFGVFTGTVQSYDESSKFFEIVYEDGDSEELDFAEVVSLLENDGVKVCEEGFVHVKPRVGRKPKKRRRMERKQREESGKSNETLERIDLNHGLVEGNGDLKLDNGGLDVEFKENLKEECGFENGNLIVDVEIKDGLGLDLNAGFNFKLNGGLNLNLNDGLEEEHEGLMKKERECIDLNLDVNGEMEDSLEVVETRKKECGFDLNLDVDDEVKDERDGDCVGKVKESILLEGVEEVFATGELKEVHVTQDFGFRLVSGIRKEESMLVEDFSAGDGCNGVQFKDESATPAATVIDGCHGDMGSSYKQESGRRKRRKVKDNLNSSTETVLRRSTRRGSARNNVLSSTTSCAFNDLSSSTTAGVSMMEDLPDTLAAERFDEPEVLPPKLQLPPSSQNLDLDGIFVLDVFSIYACLRSFSTLIFLSPFELEDFVAALKCNSPSLLFDCIHVSILRMLRKHLENLSNEGFESASNCLRSLNWNMLDLITWPVFMVEYLLIHNSGLKPGFDLTHLKLFKSDYYKQPVSVKVEMLRCLCDDMIEMETIRNELSRRSSVAEPEMDFDRNINNEFGKKRRGVMDISGGSCLTEEVVEDANDWNSDECCLCKMDGSLLCCDGCPAAYHSKCVGVANDLLPEGDWFCPECVLDRHKPWMKPRRSLRGAELLGVDPHGRFYFSSSGYLLVSDSCETECTFNYYSRNDLNVVIDVLKSSDTVYGGIINAIYKQWNVTIDLNGLQSNLDSLNNGYSSVHVKAEAAGISMHLASSETHVMNDIANVSKPEEKVVAQYSGHLDSEVSKSKNVLDSVTATEMPNISSEGSAETTQISSVIQNIQKQGPDCSNRAAEFSNLSEMPGKSPPLGDSSMTSTGSDIKEKFASPGHMLAVIKTRKGDKLRVHCDVAYMNHYTFAQTASSVAEELMCKSSNEKKEESIKSEEEVISTQTKAILKKSDKFCWPNIENLNVDTQNERCGWCFSCRVSNDDMDCLFNMNNIHVWGSLKNEVVGLQSKRNKKGHLVDVICHILSIEDRLRGLLLGPWLNPHYTKLWHKNALRAADLASVKQLLLTLESNLHHLALSADWLKHVDSQVTLGSASHIVIASSRASSKHGIGRKRARILDLEGNPSSNGAGGLSLCWWRGGRVSCQLYSWKVLPRSVVSKAARQAGCTKIPGILYPENSDFAKRSRNIAWRAAVESSTSVEQLAIQVREFDSNIRWDDIENTHPLCTMDKEFRKSIRLFKKAIIRRKCLKEGEGVKYLIDFGKRRSVPDIVLRHGSMVEESSSGRKRYWLKEFYVPLHLLKSFEERRIARKSTKLKPGKLSEATRVTKKFLRKRGLSYLFSKAERSEYHQCGHCNKDVLIREAVCCQLCKGFFHKRHIRRSAGTVTAECTYTCYQCQNGRLMKTSKKTAKSDTKKGKVNTKSAKVQSQKRKKASTDCKSVQLKNSKKPLVGRRSVRSKNDKQVAAVPLRRSARKVKFVLVQKKKPVGRKKGKQKSKKKTSKKPKKDPSWRKKRTQAYYSYWLNGLLLSRKPDDERVMQFRKKNLFDSSENFTDILDKPKCYLCCEAGYNSTSNFITCEICGERYHGDAYGLNVENINKLIGFRCHVCRKRTPPVCPCKVPIGSNGFQLVEVQNNNKMECSEDVCEPVLSLGEVKSNQQSHSNEDHQGSYPVDECFHKEEELCSSELESRLEAEKDHPFVSTELNADSILISNKDLKAGVLTSSENVMLEENTVRAVHDDTATLHGQAEPPSCKVDLDFMDTESALLQRDEEKNTVRAVRDDTATLHGQAEPPSYKVDLDFMDTESTLLQHDEEKDGLVKTTAIQKSPVDGTLLDSNELQSQNI